VGPPPLKHVEYSIVKSSCARVRGTVLLGHAMFTTYDYLFRPKGKSLADFLASKGYHVAAFNITGYGSSAPSDQCTNFDTYVLDYENFLTQILANLPKPYFYLGHSVGGLAGISAISKSHFPMSKAVLIAPAIWTKTEPKICMDAMSQRVKLTIALKIAHFFGYLPSKILGLGEVNAPVGYFEQFLFWSRGSLLSSVDGKINYQEIWKNLSLPVLILSAAKDRSMAPKSNIDWVAARFKNSTKTQVNKLLFGFDADHFSIIYGAKAAHHVWPHIVKFLDSEQI
jgi:alpha-beta hydrolase superfamily lysophospholipase